MVISGQKKIDQIKSKSLIHWSQHMLFHIWGAPGEMNLNKPGKQTLQKQNLSQWVKHTKLHSDLLMFQNGNL